VPDGSSPATLGGSAGDNRRACRWGKDRRPGISPKLAGFSGADARGETRIGPGASRVTREIRAAWSRSHARPGGLGLHTAVSRSRRAREDAAAMGVDHRAPDLGSRFRPRPRRVYFSRATCVAHCSILSMLSGWKGEGSGRQARARRSRSHAGLGKARRQGWNQAEPTQWVADGSMVRSSSRRP
jgi:hypothetical protein